MFNMRWMGFMIAVFIFGVLIFFLVMESDRPPEEVTEAFRTIAESPTATLLSPGGVEQVPLAQSNANPWENHMISASSKTPRREARPNNYSQSPHLSVLEKIHTVETLIQQTPPEQVNDVLLKTKNETEDLVRYSALDYAVKSALPVSMDTLMVFLQSDPAPNIRIFSLNLLATQLNHDLGKLEIVARSALKDPDENVKQLAQGILNELKPELNEFRR